MSFDAILRKYWALVFLALVGVIAYYQACAAMHLVGAALIVPRRRRALNFDRALTAPISSARLKSADPILARDAFDSTVGPLNKKPEANDAPTAPELSDPLSVPLCEGFRADIITESSDPAGSVAALAGKGDASIKLEQVGDEVGGMQVAYIGYNPKEESPAAWLVSGSTVCQVLLFPRAPPVTAPKAAATAVATTQSSHHGALPDEIRNKIKKLSDTEYEVDRSVVDSVLANQAVLMRSVRIVPEMKDGQVVGVRLFGVRPDTLLGVIGLQNGDRLETINGFSMSSPEKALEAYTRLRAAEGLTLQINRHGQAMTITLRFK